MLMGIWKLNYYYLKKKKKIIKDYYYNLESSGES